MAKTTAPPSRPAAPAPRPRRVDVRGWLGGIRMSGFMVIMLGLVVLAAFVLVPTLGTYIDQQQQIAALEHSVAVTEDQVADLQRDQERWADPAYITTQARERLYYVKPGEVVYLVDNDLPAVAQPQEEAKVSDTLQQTKSDWMSLMVSSVVTAGTASTARTPLTVGVPDPGPSASPTR